MEIPEGFKAYRKRPLVVHAKQMAEEFEVNTMEGVIKGKAGDVLIIGVEGEQYPCDKKIFEKSYDLVCPVGSKKSSIKSKLYDKAKPHGNLPVKHKCEFVWARGKGGLCVHQQAEIKAGTTKDEIVRRDFDLMATAQDRAGAAAEAAADADREREGDRDDPSQEEYERHEIEMEAGRTEQAREEAERREQEEEERREREIPDGPEGPEEGEE